MNIRSRTKKQADAGPKTSAELHQEVERLVAEQAAAVVDYDASVQECAQNPDDQDAKRRGADCLLRIDSLAVQVKAAREAAYRAEARETEAEVATVEAGIVEARRQRQAAKAELLEGLCKLFPEKWARVIAAEHKGQDFLTKEAGEKHDDLLNRRVALWNRHTAVKAAAGQHGIEV